MRHSWLNFLGCKPLRPLIKAFCQRQCSACVLPSQTFDFVPIYGIIAANGDDGDE